MAEYKLPKICQRFRRFEWWNRSWTLIFSIQNFPKSRNVVDSTRLFGIIRIKLFNLKIFQRQMFLKVSIDGSLDDYRGNQVKRHSKKSEEKVWISSKSPIYVKIPDLNQSVVVYSDQDMKRYRLRSDKLTWTSDEIVWFLHFDMNTFTLHAINYYNWPLFVKWSMLYTKLMKQYMYEHFSECTTEVYAVYFHKKSHTKKC